MSGDALPVSACPLLTGPLSALWPQVEAGTLPGLDLLTFRQGASDDLMLILESADPTPPELELEADISIAHLYANHTVVLAGDDHGVVEVNGRDFRISAASAFPENPAMAGRIIAHVLAHLPPAPDFIVDVFAGVGLFSAFLAPRCLRLAAIEDLPAEIEDFAVNLDEFENVELYEAAPHLALPALGARPDVVILQSGADGLERGDLDALLDLTAPTLCYISSDPSTLARDAARLIAGGYRLEQSTPFDVMPHTARIDSVSIFAR
jgi:23S rRNA (uracil1939-C5)-methyltransferase